jgi:hypothetical protein
LNYLTRLGAVSVSRLAAQFLFRVTDSVRPLPEELVNPASGLRFLRIGLRGVEPTSLTQPFPSHLGLSLECLQFSFVHHLHPSSFNELGTSYQISEGCILNVVHRVIHRREFLFTTRTQKKPNVHAPFARRIQASRHNWAAMKPPSVDKFSERFARKTAKTDEKAASRAV